MSQLVRIPDGMRYIDMLEERVAALERRMAMAVVEDYYTSASEYNTNELQRIVSNRTGGTFTLNFDGQTTTALRWDATASQIRAALIALPNIGPTDVLVDGGPLNLDYINITFMGQYAYTDVPLLGFTSSLTGGTTFTITTITVADLFVEDRDFNPHATTINEVAAVLATLIQDLKRGGILSKNKPPPVEEEPIS